MKLFNKADVLILHRSTTTAENLKKLLIIIGFKEHKIYTCYSPEAAVSAYFPVTFDLVISEHSFPGSPLTSVEIAAEIRQKNMICRNATFVIISDKPLPESGFNSDIDEVIVLSSSGFASLQEAIQRIRTAYISRQKMRLIGLAHKSEPLGELLRKCNEVEIKHPELFYPIQKYRGQFFSAHGMHNVSVNLYSSMISRLDKQMDDSWLYEMLITALIDNGQTDVAEKTFKRLAKTKESLPPRLLETQAQILLSKGDVAGAISTYELLTTKMDLDVGRLRVLGHMYLFDKKFDKSLESYLQAVQRTEGTRRTRLENQLLYIRALLYVRSHYKDSQTVYKKKFELEVNKIEKRKYTLEDKIKLSIIELHAMVFKGRLPEARKLISEIIPIIGKVDSSTRVHFLSILDDLMLEKEFAYVYKDIDKTNIAESGMESNINDKLIEQKLIEHKLRSTQSQKIARTVEEEIKKGQLEQACQTCFNGYNLYPYSERIGLHMLNILLKIQPDNVTKKRVQELIISIGKNILPLMNNETPKRNYAEKNLRLALEKYG